MYTVNFVFVPAPTRPNEVQTILATGLLDFRLLPVQATTPTTRRRSALRNIDSMPIENVMIESEQVETFAVCCTANLTIEVRVEVFASSERPAID